VLRTISQRITAATAAIAETQEAVPQDIPTS
jgi:hypothetical protein